VGEGGEMTQTLHAHMNKKNFKKRKDGVSELGSKFLG
jgi:hypothetical protein